MKAALYVNVAWAFIMVIWFGLLLAGRYSETRALTFGISIAFFVVALLTLSQYRWAAILSVGTAFLVAFRYLPMVMVNALMFVSGHELYRDSPATVFVVLIYAFVFAIPSTVLCLLYIFNYRRFWILVRRGDAHA